MADSETTKRPVRKLTVKNFSVIKEAELEFGKITVLIGPQASGKSLLCKLAFFFEQRVPEIVFDGASTHGSLFVVEAEIIKTFLSYFPDETTWFHTKYEVGASYSISIGMIDGSPTPHLLWNPGFIDHFENWKSNDPKRPPSFNSDRRRALMSGAEIGPLPIKSDSVYIPTGRAFYSTPNRAYVVLSTKNLDWVTNRYASVDFDPDYRDLLEAYQTNHVLLNKVGNSSLEMMKGKVIKDGEQIFFQSLDDGRKRSPVILSSGTLELLPIFSTLAQVAKKTGFPNSSNMPAPPVGMVFIEEPELSIFPETQYQFARLIALLSSTDLVWKSYAITTHSPYILSVFGDLVKAGKVGAQSPEHRAAVDKVIPEQYWIKEGDFAAYKIENGTLVSIFDEKTGQIDGDYLDDVSGKISDEFGQLLEIQYGH